MPDYGGPGGFGPGTTGGGEAATGGMGPGQGSGYGPSNGGDGGMSQATRDALAEMARTDVTNTDAEVEKSRLAADRFAVRMQQEADVNNPVKYSDALALHKALTTQNINPNQVSLKNFTTGPFAQKNVVMHKNKRIGQFGALPAFGLSGFLADIVGLDLRGLQLDDSTFGEPDRGGRADERSVMEILYPSEETPMEEQPIEAQPVIPGYNLAFKDFYGQQLEDGGRVGYKEGKTVEKKFEDLTKDEKEKFVKEYEKFLKEQDKKMEEAAKREREERAASGFLRFKDTIERGMPPVDERTGFYGFANPDVLDVNLRKKIEDDVYLRGGVQFPQNGDLFYSAGITKTFNKGGLASLPMNFNPMTNANPFSIMMRGGKI